MKQFLILALGAIALARPYGNDQDAQLVRRVAQQPTLGQSPSGVYWKPIKNEDLTPINPGAKRIRTWIGPFELKPANQSHGWSVGKMDPNSDSFSGLVNGLPSGLILSTNSSLKYADGTVADVINGVYNHHLAFADMSKVGRGPMRCASGGLTSMTMPNMGLLMGASEANRELQFKVPDIEQSSGFVLTNKDWIMLSGEIVNYTNETKSVYAVSDIEYLPDVPKQVLDSYLNVFNLDTCNEKPVEMPQHQMRWSLQSGKAVMTQDGYLGFRRGHMHDGGVSVELKVNGKTICDSKAVYGGEDQTTVVDGKQWETISRMESCTAPVKVAKGDTIEMTANFDVEQHPARKHSHGAGMGENMGVMTFMFAPMI